MNYSHAQLSQMTLTNTLFSESSQTQKSTYNSIYIDFKTRQIFGNKNLDYPWKS